jgi:branched-chain amino acid transport system substrate-binding protein
MTSRRLRTVSAVALAMATLAACGTGESAESSDSGSSEILIGNITSKTGQYTIGQPGDVGLKIAIDELNADGGVEVGGEKYTFKIKQLDDRSDPAATATAGRELIADGAKIIFGPVGGGALGVMQQTDPAGVVYVTPTSAAAIQLQEPGDHYLLSSIPAIATRAGSVTEAFKKFAPEAKHMVLLGSDDPVMASVVGGFEATWAEQTGATLDVVLYPAGTTDLSTYLAKVRSLDPDILYIGQNEPSVTLAMQQLDAAGIGKDVILGAHGSQAHIASEAGGRAVLAAPFISGALEGDDATEAVTTLIDKYKAETGESELPGYAAPILWYYDHMKMLAAAMEDSDSTDAGKLMDELRGTETGYDGVNGPVTFDEDGFVAYPLLMTWIDSSGAETPYTWTP